MESLLRNTKFTIEEVNLYVKNNSKCRLISKIYVNSKEDLLFECECGVNFKTSFDSFKNGNKRQCNNCGAIIKANKNRLSFEEVNTLFTTKGYIPLFKGYNHCEEKLSAIDKCGYKIFVSPLQLKQGKGTFLFHKSNPYSYENMITFIQLNEPSYSLLSKEYKGSATSKYIFKCTNNHIYKSSWDNFKQGFRCPECNESKGEKRIKVICDKYNVPYDSQYTFNDLKGLGGGLLKFDVPIFWNKEKTNLRMLIEYDGIFHYEKQYDEDKFETLQIHDKLKDKYCKNNNISLLRISYWDFDNIERILSKELS